MYIRLNNNGLFLQILRCGKRRKAKRSVVSLQAIDYQYFNKNLHIFYLKNLYGSRKSSNFALAKPQKAMRK